jgi:hypothetical protein
MDAVDERKELYVRLLEGAYPICPELPAEHNGKTL